MKGEILFIYVKKIFKPISRRQVVFTDEHIAKMVEKFRMLEAGEDEEKINEVGFTKIATIENIKKNRYVITPGWCVGIKIEYYGIPFVRKMEEYSEEFSKLLEEEKELTEKVKEVFKILGFGV